jgi:hypothetical protein
MTKDYATLLAKKGDLTILERPKGKIAVALKYSGQVVTLEGKTTKEQLLNELFHVCKNLPDRPR